jgi:hypothetical protein
VIEMEGWDETEGKGSGLLYAEQAGTASSFAGGRWLASGRISAREDP